MVFSSFQTIKLKQKYIYYHCTWAYGKNKRTNLKYYKEQEFLEQLAEAVKAIQIDSKFKKRILKAIQDLNIQEQDFQKENISRLTVDAEKIRNKIGQYIRINLMEC